MHALAGRHTCDQTCGFGGACHGGGPTLSERQHMGASPKRVPGNRSRKGCARHPCAKWGLRARLFARRCVMLAWRAETDLATALLVLLGPRKLCCFESRRCSGSWGSRRCRTSEDIVLPAARLASASFSNAVSARQVPHTSRKRLTFPARGRLADHARLVIQCLRSHFGPGRRISAVCLAPCSRLRAAARHGANLCGRALAAAGVGPCLWVCSPGRV